MPALTELEQTILDGRPGDEARVAQKQAQADQAQQALAEQGQHAYRSSNSTSWRLPNRRQSPKR